VSPTRPRCWQLVRRALALGVWMLAACTPDAWSHAEQREGGLGADAATIGREHGARRGDGRLATRRALGRRGGGRRVSRCRRLLGGDAVLPDVGCVPRMRGGRRLPSVARLVRERDVPEVRELGTVRASRRPCVRGNERQLRGVHERTANGRPGEPPRRRRWPPLRDPSARGMAPGCVPDRVVARASGRDCGDRELAPRATGNMMP
jgi:hypothetical protein